MQVLQKNARPVAGSQRAQSARRSAKMPIVRAVAAAEKTLVTTKSDEVRFAGCRHE